MTPKNEVAVFGGGCFWCIEAVFKRIKGVSSVISGYAGGMLKNPSDQDVYNGDTGHAEVIKVEFDPDVITFSKLLELFFDFHDPTTLNRQAYDVGEEYRSIILYTNDVQKEEAEKYIGRLQEQGTYVRKITTQLEPLKEFYPAASYHQDFYEKNSYSPYCTIIISPKIKHLEEKYKDLLKEK